MSRRPAEQKLRLSPQTISRQQHLVIRTASPPTHSGKPSLTSTSPPDPPYPNYPLSIPSEKLAKALRLYTQYRYEEGLEQRRREHSANGHQNDSLLGLPSPLSTYSVTSYASSRPYTATSFTTSTQEEGITDLSSLMSFNEDDERQTPASMSAEAEPIAFNGKKVKQRIRKKLPPKSKAKAALVRWLGSCWVCRRRRVPCPLLHHDIDALEVAYSARHNRPLRRPSHSSSSSSFPNPQIPLKSESTQGSAVPESSQTDFLFLGQNPRLLQTQVQHETQAEIHSPGGIAFADPLADLLRPSTIHLSPIGQDPDPNSDPDLPFLSSTPLESNPNHNPIAGPYANYQDGFMLAIGVERGPSFHCQHLDGHCQAIFSSAESLQSHFELMHFPFTRINPFHYLICAKCHCLNNVSLSACSTCGISGSIELWVYGRFREVEVYRGLKMETAEMEVDDGVRRAVGLGLGLGLDLDVDGRDPEVEMSKLGILDGLETWSQANGSGRGSGKEFWWGDG